MPRAARLSKRKFKTDKVQGPGSFIIFSKPTYDDSRIFIDELRVATQDIGVREKAREIEDEMTAMIFERAVALFVSWNWSDEEGKPLQDLDEMEDFGDLLAEEVDEITEAIRNLYGIVEDERGGKSIV